MRKRVGAAERMPQRLRAAGTQGHIKCFSEKDLRIALPHPAGVGKTVLAVAGDLSRPKGRSEKNSACGNRRPGIQILFVSPRREQTRLFSRLRVAEWNSTLMTGSIWKPQRRATPR